MRNGVKILAHRGYSAKYTENSKSAFEKAIEHNVFGLECDIQKTADNKYIIFHDDTIDRLSEASGKISEMDLVELQEIRLKNGEKILELTEFLELIPADIFINFELKKQTLRPDDPARILTEIKQYRQPHQFLFSSFDHTLLIPLRKYGVTRALLIGDGHQGLSLFKILKIIVQARTEYLNLPIDMFDVIGDRLAVFLIRMFKLQGKRFSFWTINSEQDFKKIHRFSDYIITDEVELINSLAAEI